MSRRVTVVDFPQPLRDAPPSVVQALDRLRESVGLVTSLVCVPLLLNHGGTAVVGAAGGTALLSGSSTLDLADARIDQIRLEGYGLSTASGHSLRFVQGATVLCTADLGTSAARFVGAWAVVAPAGDDVQYGLEVVGNGAATQTLYRVVLHARTIRLR